MSSGSIETISRLSPARWAAFQILLRVETQASFASELLMGGGTESLAERDAGLCTELVLGTLRWQGALDYVVARYARGGPQSLDPEVLIALRLGLYQLGVLCRIPGRMPERAAVHETVELAKAARKSSAAGMVNAVLRKFLREAAEFETVGGVGIPLPPRPRNMEELPWLAISLSHPAWLLQRWIARYGGDRAVELARSNNTEPPTFLRLPADAGRISALEEEMRAKGIELRPGVYLKRTRILARGNLARSALCREGAIAIQDEGSQLVPYLLDVQRGCRVLDLCAAPGNKTAQLSEAAGGGGWVAACDLHHHRLRQMPKFEGNLHCVTLDGVQPLPFRGTFDRILVDAPCTGTGTLRRHPEIKWRLREENIAALAETQIRLLCNAAPLLEPGGRMVYATCSLEAEENQGVVKTFLRLHPEFKLAPLHAEASRLQPFVHASANRILQGDVLETFPPRDSMDGFFAAILERR